MKVCTNPKWMLAAVSLVAALSAPAWGQDEETPAAPPPRAAAADAPVYKEMELLEAVYKNGTITEPTRRIEGVVRQVFRGTRSLEAERVQFDRYFTMYLFPKMTQSEPEFLSELANERRKLLTYLKQEINRQDVHDHVVKLTFDNLKQVAVENYHPAVRYNAMLIIGELNSREAVTSGGNPSPPEALAEAREFMLAELTNPKQIDAVRLAALIGLQRHADLNASRPADRRLPAGVRDKIVKQLLPLAADTKVPANRTVEGHAWMRERVVEILAAYGATGYDDEVARLMHKILRDTNEPFTLRFAAAQGLGRLNMSQGTLKGVDVARAMADLLVEATRDQLGELEDEIAAEKERQKLSGNYGVRGGIERGSIYGGSTIQTPREVKLQQRLLLVQRILKDHTTKVVSGLRGGDGTAGATSVAPGQQKTYIDNLAAEVAKLSKVAEMQSPTMVDLAKEMRARVTDLDRVAKTAGGPARAVPAAAPEIPEGPEGPEVPAVPAAPPARPAAPAAELPGAAEIPEAPGDAQ